MKARKLRSKYKRYNRKKYRKDVISAYRLIKKRIKKSAKKGNHRHITGKFTYEKFSHSWYLIHAFKLFARKHRDFKVKETHYDNGVENIIKFEISWE